MPIRFARIHYPALLIFIIGAFISLFLFLTIHRSEVNSHNNDFLKRTGSLDQIFTQILLQQVTLLEATEAFYSSSQNIDPDEFDVFASHLLKNKTEVLSLMFVLKVSDQDLPAYISHSQELRSGYNIRPVQGPENVKKDAYYPIHYIFSTEGEGGRFVGADLGTLDGLKEVFEEAASKRVPLLSSPVEAFEEKGEDNNADDLYIVYPLQENAADKYNAVEGFMVVGIDIPRAMQKAINASLYNDVAIRASFFQHHAKSVFFERNISEHFHVDKETLSETLGRTFLLEYGHTTKHSHNSSHAYYVLVSGLLLTLLLSGYISMWRVQQERKNRQIAETQNLNARIKKTEEEAVAQKIFLEKLLDNIPIAIFAKDVKNGFSMKMLNRAAEEMFCISEEQAFGKTDYDYFPKEEADFFRETDKKVMEKGKIVDIPAEPITTPNGTFTAHTIKIPIYDEDGQPAILLGILQDVTEKMKVLEELNFAKEQAETANIAKSDFLANTSHELRTPLNSILGMNRLLLATELSKEQRELADAVFRSSVNLLEIVNDILDLSKIESNEMVLEDIGFDIGYVFNSVMHTLAPLAKEKHITLKKNFDESDFPYVKGDPLRVTRILTNVVGNAIKYTDRGSVELLATYRPVSPGKIEIYCEVKDTGIGIPEDKIDKIFEKFGQADTSTTRKYGGTGLGLTITRQLVEMMQGEIGVRSKPGDGSVFWIRIPFGTTSELSPESRSRKKREARGVIPIQQAKILVAEDHPANQILIRKVLQKFGIGTFEIAENGKIAFDKYRAQKWDVVLMDCHMPEMNGYDATIAIRQHEKTTGSRVPIVAMTANAMVGEREKCLRYGMDDYISKPFNLEELQDILTQWLKLDDSSAVSGRPEDEKGPEKKPADLTQMRTFTDGDAEVEKELITAFVMQSDSNVKILEETAASSVTEKAWRESGHMMKGGAGGIGAARLQELCHQAQHFDGTAAQRVELYEQIKSEYARVKDYLKEIGLLD